MVVTLGITYSVFTFNNTGGNSQLVLGDIYMHYKETNQLVLNDALPININDYTAYDVNPVMATQTFEENELSKCVSYLNSTWGSEPFQYWLGNETYEAYCRGIGTTNGYTFQEDLDAGSLSNELTYFEENNIVLSNGDGTYTVNPILETQNFNELNNCVGILSVDEMPLADGETMENFCKGTGKASNGYTFQENLDNGDWFDEEYLTYFSKYAIINTKIENLPYFEFTISGKNTYEKEDIWYEIVLNYGDNHETRTTRIRDDLLKFALYEVDEENQKSLIFNKYYANLINRRIYVKTIDANTVEEIEKTYRLYMWIDKNTLIGNVENADYDMDTWNNEVFASIKVNVTGDFQEKKVLSSKLAKLNRDYAFWPTDIDSLKDTISEVNFINLERTKIENVINTNTYNENSIYNNTVYDLEDDSSTGYVKTWLVTDPDDDTKYLMYIASEDDALIFPKDSSYMFYDFQSLESINYDSNLLIDTSQVTNMSYMFCQCPKLTIVDVSSFDTSNVVNMSNMFAGSEYSSWGNNFEELDLSNFDTSKVVDMSGMFSFNYSLINLNINNFDTSNVVYMNHMFVECPKLESLNLSSFDTSKVVDMSYMFMDSHKLKSLNLSNFDTSKVVNMYLMFSYCYNLLTLDLSSFSFHQVTSYNNIFRSVGSSLPSGTKTIVYVKSDYEVNGETFSPQQWVIDKYTDWTTNNVLIKEV